MNPDCDFVASAELFSVAFCESLQTLYNPDPNGSSLQYTRGGCSS